MMKGKMSKEIFFRNFFFSLFSFAVMCESSYNRIQSNLFFNTCMRMEYSKIRWNAWCCVFSTTCKSERKIAQSINTFNWCASVKLSALIYSGQKSNGNYSKKRFHNISIANFASDAQLDVQLHWNSVWRELWYLTFDYYDIWDWNEAKENGIKVQANSQRPSFMPRLSFNACLMMRYEMTRDRKKKVVEYSLWHQTHDQIKEWKESAQEKRISFLLFSYLGEQMAWLFSYVLRRVLLAELSVI